MKTKITLLTTAILFSLNVFSQAPDWHWATAIGNIWWDEGTSMAVDGSGNIYTTGYFQSTVDFDPGSGIFNLTTGLSGDAVFISKLDASGNFIWAKAMNGTGSSVAYSIAQAGTGVYTTGYFGGTVDFDPGPGVFYMTAANFDIFISKLDVSGNFVWVKSISGTNFGEAHSITVDPSNGDVYTTGWFSGTADFDPGAGVFNITSAGGYDSFISKLDSSGNFIWAKAMGGANTGYGFSLVVDSAGNRDIYMTGTFMDTVDFDPGPGVFNLISDGVWDIFISKLDASGNFIWAKRIGGQYQQMGYSIAIGPGGNGGIYSTGIFSGTVDFDPGSGVFSLTSIGSSEDIFILHLDSAGNFVWAKAIGEIGTDVGHFITPDASGNMFITGWFQGTVDFDPGPGVFNLTSSISDDFFIFTLDASGNFIWAKGVGGNHNDRGHSIAIHPEGGRLFVTGSFESSSITFGADTFINSGTGSADIFIAILDTLTITGNDEAKNFSDNILFFPNPVSGELVVRSLGSGDVKLIEIYNAFGQKIFSQQPAANSQQQLIDVSQWNAGIYLVSLSDKNGNKMTGRFVKL